MPSTRQSLRYPLIAVAVVVGLVVVQSGINVWFIPRVIAADSPIRLPGFETASQTILAVQLLVRVLGVVVVPAVVFALGVRYGRVTADRSPDEERSTGWE